VLEGRVEPHQGKRGETRWPSLCPGSPLCHHIARAGHGKLACREGDSAGVSTLLLPAAARAGNAVPVRPGRDAAGRTCSFGPCILAGGAGGLLLWVLGHIEYVGAPVMVSATVGYIAGMYLATGGSTTPS
jgi:hypothetical protein